MPEALRVRKHKTLDPCPTCRLHRARCICTQIPKLNLKTRVAIIIHHKELKRTTNTGQLVHHALENSSMHVRGKIGAPLDLTSLLSPEYDSYVLYPSLDAVEIETIQKTRPIQLIVSDGNWRQAAKINTRHPELRHLPRVRIRGMAGSQYHLRKEHFADGLATIEAIAFALKALEGDSVGETLLNLYRAKLRATLEGRGQRIMGVWAPYEVRYSFDLPSQS